MSKFKLSFTISCMKCSCILKANLLPEEFCQARFVLSSSVLIFAWKWQTWDCLGQLTLWGFYSPSKLRWSFWKWLQFRLLSKHINTRLKINSEFSIGMMWSPKAKKKLIKYARTLSFLNNIGGNDVPVHLGGFLLHSFFNVFYQPGYSRHSIFVIHANLRDFH